MNNTMWLVLVVAIIAITILGAMIHITLYITKDRLTERIEDDEQAEVESISVTSKGDSFDKKET